MPTIVTGKRTAPAYGAMFSVDAIKRANTEAGYYYFTPDTMRFFRSRVLPTVIAGRLFITSEQQDWNTPRCYTVREFLPDGSIETVGDFMGHATSASAKRAARAYAAEPHAYYFDGQHGKGGRKRVYVVTAPDAWAAMDALHSNFRVFFMGHAADYMLTNAENYPQLTVG